MGKKKKNQCFFARAFIVMELGDVPILEFSSGATHERVCLSLEDQSKRLSNKPAKLIGPNG